MICRVHFYNPKRHGKPVHYESCGMCRKLFDQSQRRRGWNRSEKKTGSLFGARRNPGSGATTPSNRGDVTREGFAQLFSLIENRQRATWAIPAWIAECEAKTPVTGPWLLVVSRPGEGKSYAIMSLEDLAAYLGEYAVLLARTG
jgi:hypothetical protein